MVSQNRYSTLWGYTGKAHRYRGVQAQSLVDDCLQVGKVLYPLGCSDIRVKAVLVQLFLKFLLYAGSAREVVDDSTSRAAQMIEFMLGCDRAEIGLLGSGIRTCNEQSQRFCSKLLFAHWVTLGASSRLVWMPK